MIEKSGIRIIYLSSSDLIIGRIEIPEGSGILIVHKPFLFFKDEDDNVVLTPFPEMVSIKDAIGININHIITVVSPSKELEELYLSIISSNEKKNQFIN